MAIDTRDAALERGLEALLRTLASEGDDVALAAVGVDAIAWLRAGGESDPGSCLMAAAVERLEAVDGDWVGPRDDPDLHDFRADALGVLAAIVGAASGSSGVATDALWMAWEAACTRHGAGIWARLGAVEWSCDAAELVAVVNTVCRG